MTGHGARDAAARTGRSAAVCHSDSEPSDVPLRLARALRVMAESNNAASHEATELSYVQYESGKEEDYLPSIRQLIGKDLSEPYSIYVYRYFLYQWGDLCFMVCQNRQLWTACR